MLQYIERVKYVESKLSDKRIKRLATNELVRMIDKVKEIEDETMIGLLDETVRLLEILAREEQQKAKEYTKKYNEVKKHIRDTYGFIAKGTLQGEFLAIGMAMGAGFGSIFIVINPAFMSIGIPIGLSIGLAIGSSKEKEAEKEDKLY